MEDKSSIFKKHSDFRPQLKPSIWVSLLLMAIVPHGLMAQIQEGLPKPSDPIDLSDTSDLVIFIILPILVFILYLFWRKAIKKRNDRRK
ncbi:hypothetical protein [Cyclobacterium qasimii]|uniref:Adenylosuccinate synthetase n=2 Tax=Cyclobacterium qasimii TaxID=1350429 RepID=S7WVP1_9BACT|nr:hypothetical protein [Cyclobacterium qasimii]EPR70824.1 hypothetical protein ADICYQ_0820 [Cyclobacterium qasimii M12-11B]GEO24069.1 hypothetical protein CQA01_46030 [Cyclobacterium qasimii]